MKRMVGAVAILAVVGAFGFAADGSTLSGTFTHSAVEDEVTAYIKLVSDGNCMAPGPGEYAAMATFSEGEASYTIEGVTDGAYTACAFIDVVAQEGEVHADSGDYGAMVEVTVAGDTVVDVEEASWMPIP